MQAYYSPAAYATRVAEGKPLPEVFLRSKADGHETRMYFERITGIEHSEHTGLVGKSCTSV
jgi:hypothetical protein